MIIYSSTILLFLKKIKNLSKQIMKDEMKITFKSKRFLYKNYSIPLNFIVFNCNKKLGFFDPSFYQIGINQNFLKLNNTNLLKNTLRHELAHLICFIEYGENGLNHDRNFRNICKRYEWGQEIYNSKVETNLHEINFDENKFHKVFEKVKKLYALSESSNQNEAELAASKANKLINQYNLDFNFDDDNEEDKELVLINILESKRSNIKLQTIVKILNCFLVNSFINQGQNKTYISIIGSLENVKISEYIAHSLSLNLELIWKKAKKENKHLNKNSFFIGLAEGHINKMNSKSSFKEFNYNDQNKLITIKNELNRKVDLYLNLKKTKANCRFDRESYKQGYSEGKNLKIRKGIERKSNVLKLISLN